MPRATIAAALVAALLWSTDVAVAGGLSPAQAAKLRTARHIYDDLVRAVGDGRSRPQLRLLPDDQGGDAGAVWFEPDRGVVMLEERAYDVLATGPDSLDALAFVLGHELAHYYRDHDWTGSFVRSFADLEVGRTLKGLAGSTRRAVEVEAEADYFSGFYGRMAGYHSLTAAPKALERIYREYDLAERLPGYPALGERQAVATRTAQELRRMLPVFDGGNRLLLAGRYTEAASCFDFIARTFPSREILNNAGISRALAAIELHGAGELPFAYPLELDAATRLHDSGKADHYQWEESAGERRARLLRDAREALEMARRRDPAYAVAVVNLACVADLLGEHDEAILLTGKAIDLAGADDQARTRANAWIVRGIAHARAVPPDEARARHCFRQALAASEPLARWGLAALEGRSPAEARGAAAGAIRPESIDGLRARDYDLTITESDSRTRVPPIFETETDLTFYVKSTPGWSSLVIDTGYSTVSFRSVGDAGRAASARGIAVGASLDQVTAAYGPPSAMVAGTKVTHLVYRASRIIFDVDGGGVVGWTIYDVE